jgi:hypothetical protein
MPEPPYELIADGLKDGSVVPFFGASASAAYRPDNREPWHPGKNFMPFGGEVATTLANAASYRAAEEAYNAVLGEVVQSIAKVVPSVSENELRTQLPAALREHLFPIPSLPLIASWTEHVQADRRALDRKLRQFFAVNCSPGLLHEKLASIPATKIYITTNYDNLLEQALSKRQPHLIVDRGGGKGFLVGVAGGAPAPVAASGKELYELLGDPDSAHPIIFKMHGTVDLANPKNDSFLVTEEDYVDFLGRDQGNYIPPYLFGLMQDKNFLFLGYSLADWNVRVIMHKLLKQSAERPRFWAIVRGRSDIEEMVWQSKDVNIYPMDIRVFSEKLAEFL